jgi:acetyltransferase-like isoleucine patch superfamily enzyme
VREGIFFGIKNRILQHLARNVPGALSLRPRLHRWRGVKMGNNVWVGYDAIIETSYPRLVTIKDGATIGIRTLIIAHFRGTEKGVVIEEDAFLGPGVIVLPNVVIGRGSVVTAGSVVTSSVPPMTLVQGNPAKPIARVGKPPKPDVSFQEFAASLRPLKPGSNRAR